jgi:hypothetical protein
MYYLCIRNQNKKKDMRKTLTATQIVEKLNEGWILRKDRSLIWNYSLTKGNESLNVTKRSADAAISKLSGKLSHQYISGSSQMYSLTEKRIERLDNLLNS